MLATVTLLSLATLTGSEFCVAAFTEPVLRSLPETEQVRVVPPFASILGRVMPGWYAATLLLTVATLWMQHSRTGAWFPGVLTALLLQLAVLALTLSYLVPRNNRLSRLTAANATWLQDAREWDRMHWLRVALLLAATLAFAFIPA